MKFLLNSVALFTVLSASHSATAATYHVSPQGSNTPPYDTYAKAAHRIQDAIDQTVAGDTVLIGSGVYHPDTTIVLRDSISVIGAGRDSTVIAPSHTSLLILNLAGTGAVPGGGLLFQGCQVRGIKKHGTNIALQIGLRIDSKLPAGNTIRDNTFIYCSDGLNLANAVVDVYENYFDSNETAIDFTFSGPFNIHHNRIRGRALSKGVSTPIFALTRATVTDNIVIMDRGGGISVKGIEDSVIIENNLVVTGEGFGIWSFCECAGAVIRNNTVHRYADYWSGGAIAGFTTWGNSRVLLENNVFVGTGQTEPLWLWQYYGGTTRFAYNSFWGVGDSVNWESAVVTTEGFAPEYEGNFVAYPMFAWDTVGVIHDSLYRLQRGSPLVDAGNPLILDTDGSRSDVGWTGGAGGGQYDYPELAPNRPESLGLTTDGNVVMLAWTPRYEADLDHYRVYRDVVSEFWQPGLTPLKIVDGGATSTSDTLLTAGESYFYVVTAVDTTGLESMPSPEVEHMVTGVFDDQSDNGLPRAYGIAGAYPNPFNAGTVIEIHSPPSSLTWSSALLVIYDVLGRPVWSSSIDLSESGTTQYSWAARNSGGAALSSGLYFARLRVGDTFLGRTTKLIMLK